MIRIFIFMRFFCGEYVRTASFTSMYVLAHLDLSISIVLHLESSVVCILVVIYINFGVFFQLKCGNCGEVSEKWQYLRLMDSHPLKGGRGSATMVQKCKLCSRENSIDILSHTMKPYNAEDNETFKTIVEFECRGLEPVDFQPQAGFAANGAESGTSFSDINLLEKDWNEYDEKIKESVGIYEVTHRFVKC
uniref:CXXC motif containing zinc binding protein n=1 Tax=Anolis carolinensis TaxID=28377 RepID=A0A803T1D7_ANOCA